ncbi:MAG TPA: hypothetical protein VN770_10875 [Gaiellaceae bacterium]|nr:hypothetical protein [Gaiellaceae bacterium]
MSGKRMLLFGVAGLLTASALLAIGILLVGRFGGTEGRILGTTALLAGYGLVALPATALLDRGHFRALAAATASLAAAGASLALASVWIPSAPDALGNTVGAVTAFALAGAQVSALAARRQPRDPPVVRRLFAVSCGSALVAASLFAALVWTQASGLYPRLFGAVVVLDLLLVALQPLLARARPAGPTHRLRIVLTSGVTIDVTVEGGDLATATAKAIRNVERSGGRVARLDVDYSEVRAPTL